jgi:hypothetical protein
MNLVPPFLASFARKPALSEVVRIFFRRFAQISEHEHRECS